MKRAGSDRGKRPRRGYTDLERTASGGKELETGIFPGVFPEVGHQLHVVLADIEGAFLLLVCREGDTGLISSAPIYKPLMFLMRLLRTFFTPKVVEYHIVQNAPSLLPLGAEEAVIWRKNISEN